MYCGWTNQRRKLGVKDTTTRAHHNQLLVEGGNWQIEGGIG